MKKIVCVLSLLFLALIGFSQEAPEGLFLNSKAPDFSAKDQNGNTVRLKDLLKKKELAEDEERRAQDELPAKPRSDAC